MAEIIKLKQRQKNGGLYTFRCRYKNDKGETKYYTSGAFKTKRECEDAERQFKIHRKEKQLSSSNMTFGELYTRFYETRKPYVADNTLTSYEFKMSHCKILEDVKLKNFEMSTYRMWEKAINETDLCSRTKNYVLSFIKTLLTFASKEYNFNFADLIFKMDRFENKDEKQKEISFYTLDEFEKFIAVEDDLLYQAIFTTFFYQGLRFGELRGLTWEDIDFSSNRIDINKTATRKRYEVREENIKRPKTKSGIRKIPMGDQVHTILKQLKDQVQSYNNFEENWFCFGNSMTMSECTIRDRNKRNSKLSNQKRISIHGFRHSCVSYLINNKVDVSVISRYIGHKDVSTTLRIYTKLYDDPLEDIVQALNNPIYKK